jgi:hypothetical protein
VVGVRFVDSVALIYVFQKVSCRSGIVQVMERFGFVMPMGEICGWLVFKPEDGQIVLESSRLLDADL